MKDITEFNSDATRAKAEQSQSSLSVSDRPYRWFGVLVLLLTFGIFGGWAYTAKIDNASLAPGFVSVKYNSKSVQHLDGGIVTELNVREGDLVEAGDVLIVLDDTQIRAQRDITMGQLLSLSALESRLIAEQTWQEKVDYPELLQVADDPRAAEAMMVENEIFKARRESMTGEVKVLEQRIQQLRNRRVGLEAQRDSNERLTKSLTEEIDELRDLLKEGFAEKQRLRERERQFNEAEGSIGELTAEIAALDVQIGETRLEILQLRKERSEEVATRLAEVQNSLFDVREKLTAQEDVLRKTQILAPVTGKVLGLAVHTIGGVIGPRERIMEIVPEDEELAIIARVNPIDIDRVSVGQSAEVRFSAFHFGTTPRMFAEVVKVSPDRIQDRDSKEVYYEARLEVTTESLLEMNNLVVLPGMPAEVLISSGERTLFEYLSKPVTDAFSRAFLEE
ncbi:Type I secretion membrane fusion protein, HlyD [Methylophaga frappieri]|uniref:Membrane fusion protein (MFP) family protein n=1 Tax=Methylophaga frappieri (strain ATCC BAA-2434 / DSM 25690 / JAM7) TaxID=754477 RepID=I1YKI1_METFJ|nr:HlyD family type I secretion periplasmic adaptor subunit [Methylophaga frappieri]AFJ03424.1 Type I secretion membrane fusion protein, HlyD [Methylophaga frappieri]